MPIFEQLHAGELLQFSPQGAELNESHIKCFHTYTHSIRDKHFSSLKCLYINVHSTGNRQEELEICVQLQGYDLSAITEIWWDSLHNWNAVMEGYMLFRRPARKERW